MVRRHVFRADGTTTIMTVNEFSKKGNFLGILNAWKTVKQAIAAGTILALPQVFLITMVFGQGKRLSPFTQALGKRKSAFPTLYRVGPHPFDYLNLAEACSFYSNAMVDYLCGTGFHGVLVRWGDEILIPESPWPRASFRDVDVVRFVGQPKLDPQTAREKEWLAVSKTTGHVEAHFPRQDLERVRSRIAGMEQTHYLGVNLGSLALSYDFLESAMTVFGDDVESPERWLDADPYLWVGLLAREANQWLAQEQYEAQSGLLGLRSLYARYPDFMQRMAELRRSSESRSGRRLAIAALDFGNPLWVDMGLACSSQKGTRSCQ